MAPTRIILSLSFWFCLSAAAPLQAQQTTWGVGTNFGYILPHRNEMLALVTGHSHGLTGRIGNWATTGWRQNYSRHGPAWQGLELGWLNGGSPELGNFAHAMWLVSLPVRSRWHFEFATGIGWSTTPYDVAEAPLSIAIGSRLNAGIHLGTSAQLVQLKNGWMALGTGLTHFSNGALALPNLGVNNIYIRLEAGWSTQHQFSKSQVPEYNNETEGWRWAIAGRAGARDINLPGGVLHPTISTSAYALKRADAIHAWTLALDLAHNQSLRQFSEIPLTMAQKLQFSSLAGVNLNFGRAHLMLLQGWVWTHPDEALGRRHLQAILAYDVRPSWAIELGLRSFRLRADYPFIGIRYQPATSR